jgi:site-specific DNA-methyltransferase (adenine-specific)
MTPYYEHAGITIYHGDCREVLPSIGAIDSLISDPPYGIGFAEYATHEDNADEYADFIWPIISSAEGHISDGYCCVMQSAKLARRWSSLFPREWRLIALPKNFVQMNTDRRLVGATDYALLWTIGTTPKRRGLDAPRDWFLCNTSDMSKKVKGHPCPRPIDGMKYLVECASEIGWTILDPFMGSGTTLHAAKELGRQAIGIEIEERYCEIAAKRLSQEVLPLQSIA